MSVSALDLYLSAAPLAELLTYVSLAILAVGLGPFVPGLVADHVSAARGEVR